jgi:hypothetical protein
MPCNNRSKITNCKEIALKFLHVLKSLGLTVTISKLLRVCGNRKVNKI